MAHLHRPTDDGEDATVQAFLAFLAKDIDDGRLQEVAPDLVDHALMLVRGAEVGDLTMPLSPLDD